MGSPDRPHRACREPPDSSIIYHSKKVTQILGRLFRSFSDSYFWSMITIWIIAAMIFSATILPALGSSMKTVASEYEGRSTPVLEVRAIFPDGWNPRFYDTFLNNQTITGSFDPWAGYWRNCFTEGDVNKIAGLDGVESVVRVLDYEARYRPEVLTPEMVKGADDALKDYSNMTSSILDRASYRKLAQSWNMTPSEYFTMNWLYSDMVVRCIDVEAVSGWDLGFGGTLKQIAKADLNSSIVVSQFMLNDARSTLKVGEKALFIIGQAGEYSPGFPYSTGLENTTTYYDERHIYSFDVESSYTSGSTWNGREPGIVMDLNTLLHILEKERNPEGVPLPIYTSLLVKPTLQEDYAKLENKLRGMFPNTTISRAGTAPTMISDRAAQAASRIYGLTNIYTPTIALLGAGVLLVEAIRNRKMLWLLKSRGWTRLDVLSYNLARSAVLGVVGGCLALLVIAALKPLTANLLLPQALIDSSPSILSTVQRVLNESMSGYTIYTLPIIGITATVLCSVPATIFFLLTKPKENLYDSPSN